MTKEQKNMMSKRTGFLYYAAFLLAVLGVMLIMIYFWASGVTDDMRRAVDACIGGPEILRATCRTAEWRVGVFDTRWAVLALGLVSLALGLTPLIAMKQGKTADRQSGGFAKRGHAITVVVDQLDYGPSIAKRLDEHREFVEAVIAHTKLYETHPWHIAHAAEQDDYLMRMFHLVHGCWPGETTGASGSARFSVRPRPALLPKCQLPEYDHKDKAGEKRQ